VLNRRDQLRGVAERDGLEQILKRPTAGQVNADATSCLTDAGTDFEQLNAQGFDLCRAHRRRQSQAKEVDQVIGETVEQQAERIGAETMAAQTVSSKAIFKLLNTVLTLATIVIERKNGTAAAWQVGDQETQVATGRGLFGLVADAPLMRPGASPIAKAGKRALRFSGSTITSRETTLDPLRPACNRELRPIPMAYCRPKNSQNSLEQWYGETSVSA
jgi:hypothetical protein